MLQILGHHKEALQADLPLTLCGVRQVRANKIQSVETSKLES